MAHADRLQTAAGDLGMALARLYQVLEANRLPRRLRAELCKLWLQGMLELAMHAGAGSEKPATPPDYEN